MCATILFDYKSPPYGGKISVTKCYLIPHEAYSISEDIDIECCDYDHNDQIASLTHKILLLVYLVSTVLQACCIPCGMSWMVIDSICQQHSICPHTLHANTSQLQFLILPEFADGLWQRKIYIIQFVLCKLCLECDLFGWGCIWSCLERSWQHPAPLNDLSSFRKSHACCPQSSTSSRVNCKCITTCSSSLIQRCTAWCLQWNGDRCKNARQRWSEHLVRSPYWRVGDLPMEIKYYSNSADVGYLCRSRWVRSWSWVLLWVGRQTRSWLAK